MPSASRKIERGFSLLELMASLSIFLVIAAAVFEVLVYYQQNYQRTQLTVDMHDSLRGAIDMLTQEIGQAGLLSSNSNQVTTLGEAVTAGITGQSVTFTSASSIFVGEQLLVDTGFNQELVAVTSVTLNNVTGIFAKNHSNGAAINVLGVFPQGVLSSSTANQLQLVGDINGDGTLVYVEYDCNNQAPGPGTLTRSVTPISAPSKNAASILLDKVMPNPGGTPCFQYPSPLPSAAGFTFVPQVGVTLTVQSSSLDPVTQTYLTITKQALDLMPRNVQMGLAMANSGVTSSLQPAPPGIPFP
ncbi:MAG: prepilin-type N-terminal cleavage/methylation domain-containing protein [Candidatus Acidiferrales bacterium]